MTSRVVPIAWKPLASMIVIRFDSWKCDANSSASQIGPSLLSPSPTMANTLLIRAVALGRQRQADADRQAMAQRAGGDFQARERGRRTGP